MRKELEPLLTPWKIGKCEIKNRFVLTSMGGTDLFGWMEKNHFDKAGARFIMDVAKNNCGLVLPGCQPVYSGCRVVRRHTLRRSSFSHGF